MMFKVAQLWFTLTMNNWYGGGNYKPLYISMNAGCIQAQQVEMNCIRFLPINDMGQGLTCSSIKFVLRLVGFLAVTINACLSDTYAQQSVQNHAIQYHADSIFVIQFIALRDTNQTFSELEFIGDVIKEYLPERNICRYNLGNFTNRGVANAALELVRLSGYRDAFIRKKKLQFVFPSELISEQQPLEIDSSLQMSEEVTTIKRGDFQSSQTQQPLGSELDDRTLDSSGNGAKQIASFSILYTGKSLGILGKTRFQNEHELVTEHAIRNEIKFKLVSHACWRSKGLTVFLPSDEPEGHELDLILKERKNWETLEAYPAIRTNNVVLFRDPDRIEIDMLDIVLQHEQVKRAYPEIEKIQVRIYRTVIDEDKECFIVEEPGAVWPQNQKHWTLGEVNRVDFGKEGRMFELPSNQGNFDSRISVLKHLEEEIKDEKTMVLKIDLGHRNGDFDVSASQRATADLQGLSRLGYNMLVPYEFELSLGSENIRELKKKNPDVIWLASNITSTDTTLFSPYEIFELEGIQLGFIGLVEPKLATNLPG